MGPSLHEQNQYEPDGHEVAGKRPEKDPTGINLARFSHEPRSEWERPPTRFVLVAQITQRAFASEQLQRNMMLDEQLN